MTWIAAQLRQPTYIQMRGSVCQLGNFMDLRDSKPTKTGPMRIEMATAACRTNTHVEEFTEPTTIIYGRPNSDRASYGPQARRENFDLLCRLAKYVSVHPTSVVEAPNGLASQVLMHAKLRLRHQPLPREEWRVRGWVDA